MPGYRFHPVTNYTPVHRTEDVPTVRYFFSGRLRPAPFTPCKFSNPTNARNLTKEASTVRSYQDQHASRELLYCTVEKKVNGNTGGIENVNTNGVPGDFLSSNVRFEVIY